MAAQSRKSLDQEDAFSILGEAEALIRSDRFADAAQLYRRALAMPVLAELPTLRTEALANLGALLLHEARNIPAPSETGAILDEAIDLLARAHAAYRRGEGGTGRSSVSDTNLALAYFQRHLARGHDADLMAAHLALDGVEATLANDDNDTRDWVRSVRDLLVEHVERRREPR